MKRLIFAAAFLLPAVAYAQQPTPVPTASQINAVMSQQFGNEQTQIVWLTAQNAALSEELAKVQATAAGEPERTKKAVADALAKAASPSPAAKP